MGTPTWHPGYTLPGTHGYTHLYTMHEAALLYRTLKNTIYMQLFAKPVSQKEVNTMVAVYWRRFWRRLTPLGPGERVFDAVWHRFNTVLTLLHRFDTVPAVSGISFNRFINRIARREFPENGKFLKFY